MWGWTLQIYLASEKTNASSFRKNVIKIKCKTMIFTSIILCSLLFLFTFFLKEDEDTNQVSSDSE